MRVEPWDTFQRGKVPCGLKSLGKGKECLSPILQDFRHHPQRGNSAEQPGQVQDSPTGCIATGRRKRNSKQRLSKYENFGYLLEQDRELSFLLRAWMKNKV